MKVFVQGLWHCGCVVSACLASLKHDVIAYDDNKKTINRLKNNKAPLYEPGLNNLISETRKKKKLSFSNNLSKLNTADIIWFAYDTPININDEGDTKTILNKIKNTLIKLKSKKFIIISSQLPVGTIKSLEIYAKSFLKKKFHFFCCPENLRLGNSLSSFLNANRMVVGYRDSISKKKINNFLKTINNNLLWMKIESAEITKHAINSFLASSISFINEISLICEHTKADASEVEEGLKSEIRIGRKAFLSPGSPFFGGTLGRDLNYLNKISRKINKKTSLLSSIKISNENHKKWIYTCLQNLIISKKIKKVAIWGLTYTENVSTLRRSLAIEIADWLISRNIKVFAYDSNIKKFPSKISKLSSPLSKITNMDLLILLQKSEKFTNISAKKLKKINKHLLLFDPNNVCNHFSKYYKNQYVAVGKYNPILKKQNSFINYDYNFKNKTVLVTGASKGLGYEIAKNFLKHGSNLIICSRNHVQIKKVYKKLNKIKKLSQKIFYSATDVSSFKQVNKLISTSIKKFKKIDILVNNAAIYGPKGSIEKTNWNDWTKTVQINLIGSILLCRAVIPHFKKNNKGKIIQLSGGGATKPFPFFSSYAVSKAAIVRFVEGLAEEVKNYNIDINAVAPGPLNTDMLKEVLKAGPKNVGKEFYKKSLTQKIKGGTPFKKACELILFLSSKHSDGINGKIISALWDDWKNWANNKQLLQNSDVYTLRRIIGNERGFEWGDK